MSHHSFVCKFLTIGWNKYIFRCILFNRGMARQFRIIPPLPSYSFLSFPLLCTAQILILLLVCGKQRLIPRTLDYQGVRKCCEEIKWSFNFRRQAVFLTDGPSFSTISPPVPSCQWGTRQPERLKFSKIIGHQNQGFIMGTVIQLE